MSTKARILIIEDTAPEREAISRLLELQSFEVVSDGDADHAKNHVRDPFDLVISDLRMGRESGVDLLRYWKQHRPTTPFLLLTAHADIDTAVEAMQLGAVDFLTKPIDPRKLVSRINRYLNAAQQPTNGRASAKHPELDEVRLAVRSEASRRVMQQIDQAARSMASVLLCGPAGIGKRTLAAAIHQQSSQSAKPLVRWRAGEGLPAAQSRELLDRWNATGTLLVEDVEELREGEQRALLGQLRRLEEEDRPSGRVLATTCANLERLVREGTFRNELYHRLSVLSIRIPALRERREDVPALAARMLEESCHRHGKPLPQIDPRLAETLREFDWPGNIRQLANTIEHLVSMDQSGALSRDDLPESIRPSQEKLPGFTMPQGAKLHDLEEAAIKQTLDRCNGNRTHAAKSLGVSVRTLQRRLKSWGIN